MTVPFCFNLQNHPTFHSEERLVNLLRGGECFVGLSILLVYGETYLKIIVDSPIDTPFPHQVALAATVEYVTVGMLATAAQLAHGAVSQRLQIHAVQIQNLDPPPLRQAKVLRLNVTEVDRGLEHDVEFLEQVQESESQFGTLGPASEGASFCMIIFILERQQN